MTAKECVLTFRVHKVPRKFFGRYFFERMAGAVSVATASPRKIKLSNPRHL